MLKGWKTYLTAIGFAILSGLRAAGIITQEQFDALLAILTAFGFAAMRAAVGKVIAKP